MLTDVFQWLQIAQSRRLVNEAWRDAASAQRAVEQLEQSVERLTLACAALWELLKESGAFDDDELLKRIMHLDLRDGSLDGRLNSGPRACPECGRKNGAKRTSCLYCGRAMPRVDPFT
ncbi:MAG: hypothetical protein H6825_16780 [Planctomycetes bacterium]|nr:hypothetical protein [Planctomycetota bacterium]